MKISIRQHQYQHRAEENIIKDIEYFNMKSLGIGDLIDMNDVAKMRSQIKKDVVYFSLNLIKN